MAKFILAGDIGGTNTRLGLFETAPRRPRPIAATSYGTLDYGDLSEMIAAFLRETKMTPSQIASSTFGVAGPVIDEAAELTNVPWRVDARRVARENGFPRVRLLNDLEALAHAVPVLNETETLVLQEGQADEQGNIAIIAAGTGLGEALLPWLDGRRVPSPSEGGHADFSARTEREIVLLRDLTSRYGRADVEHVVSGRGLINIHRVAHKDACAAGVDLSNPIAPAAISLAALDEQCPGCVETLSIFVEAYGAEAGNLALRSVASGGVFIGGGIAPKILPALMTESFMRAFNEKPPLEAMLRAMPVKIILNAEAGLLGAAVSANST